MKTIFAILLGSAIIGKYCTIHLTYSNVGFACVFDSAAAVVAGMLMLF